MKTKTLECIEEAAEILQAGGLVAFPTETVFGLGANAQNKHAIERLFEAKGRPTDNPLIVHLADRRDWPLAARSINPMAERILQAFSPGPVTVVLPKAPAICDLVTAGLDTVGIRIPAADVAQRLLRAANIPVAAPSANLSGRPSGTTWQSVLEDLDGRIDAVLKVDCAHVGLESSVIDCTGTEPVLLRPGAVGLCELQILFPRATQIGYTAAAGSSLSPGIRHPHYQPRARVQLLESTVGWHPPVELRSRSYAYAGLEDPPDWIKLARQFDSIAEYAHGFYEFLRMADRAGVDVVLLQTIPVAAVAQSGIAAALADRQLRAAGLA